MPSLLKKIRDFPKGNSFYDRHYAGAKHYLAGRTDSDLMSDAININSQHRTNQRRSAIMYELSKGVIFIAGSLLIQNLLIYKPVIVSGFNVTYGYSVWQLIGSATMLAIQIAWAHNHIVLGAEKDAANLILKERGMSLDDVL